MEQSAFGPAGVWGVVLGSLMERWVRMGGGGGGEGGLLVPRGSKWEQELELA